MNRGDLAMVGASMTEFDKVSAGLAELNARFPVDAVYDVSTTKGMADAVVHRAAWRDPRIGVEKLRKAAKAPVTQLGKSIDERARWLTEQLLLGEEPIDQLIKTEEARKEAAKQAKIDAETARVVGIQEALADIHLTCAAAIGKPSAVIQLALNDMMGRFIDAAVYQEMTAQANAAKAASVDRLTMALKAALHDEAQALADAQAKAAQDAQAKVDAEELAELRRQQRARKAADEAQAAALAAQQVAAQTPPTEPVQTPAATHAAPTPPEALQEPASAALGPSADDELPTVGIAEIKHKLGLETLLGFVEETLHIYGAITSHGIRYTPAQATAICLGLSAHALRVAKTFSTTTESKP
jgi:hypothetical protein